MLTETGVVSLALVSECFFMAAGISEIPYQLPLSWCFMENLFVMISSKDSVPQSMTWPTTKIAASLPLLPYMRSCINSCSGRDSFHLSRKHTSLFKITLLFPLQYWNLWPWDWRSDYHVPSLWSSVWVLETKFYVFGFKGMYVFWYVEET